jgi:NTE family protein
MFFRRPLGLALAGGGAFGAWQASAVRELARQGLVFDAVLGVSAGAITGASYALDRMDETLQRWTRIEEARLLRLKPSLKPLALCSSEPLYDWIGRHVQDETARQAARCRLIVVSACPQERRTIYAVFDRQSNRWDGELGRHLVASCSIPTIFPPVETAYQGKTMRLVDGGMPGLEPFTFGELAHCKDVIVVEMPSQDTLLARLNRGRKKGRHQMSEGIASLRRLQEPPRIFQLTPSCNLGFEPLSFRVANVMRGFDLGLADAADFAARPESRLLPA